jgi:hypothetical protein
MAQWNEIGDTPLIGLEHELDRVAALSGRLPRRMRLARAGGSKGLAGGLSVFAGEVLSSAHANARAIL